MVRAGVEMDMTDVVGWADGWMDESVKILITTVNAVIFVHTELIECCEMLIPTISCVLCYYNIILLQYFSMMHDDTDITGLES